MVPILAVDADPNTNLGDSLGLSIGKTIGSIIGLFHEEKIDIPAGMTKKAYLEYKFSEAIVESEGVDLIVMGRGEGQECYCYPNLVLREFIDTLAENYAYIVMDNEAGMEHLSRSTTQNVDQLLIISDHSLKGVRTAARIRDLVSELKLVVKRQSVIVNFVPTKLDPLIAKELDRLEIEPIATIPLDEEVYEYDVRLEPLIDLPDTSKAVRAINELMAKIL
jgi:CO dehydrogenase maturation factor